MNAGQRETDLLARHDEDSWGLFLMRLRQTNHYGNRKIIFFSEEHDSETLCSSLLALRPAERLFGY